MNQKPEIALKTLYDEDVDHYRITCDFCDENINESRDGAKLVLGLEYELEEVDDMFGGGTFMARSHGRERSFEACNECLNKLKRELDRFYRPKKIGYPF